MTNKITEISYDPKGKNRPFFTTKNPIIAAFHNLPEGRQSANTAAGWLEGIRAHLDPSIEAENIPFRDRLSNAIRRASDEDIQGGAFVMRQLKSQLQAEPDEDETEE